MGNLKTIIHLDPQNSEKVSAPNSILERLKSNPDVIAGMFMQQLRQDAAMQLRTWRKKAGLTQTEIAKRMNTTQKQISRMESCTQSSNNITLDMMARYAHACSMKIELTAQPITDDVIHIMERA